MAEGGTRCFFRADRRLQTTGRRSGARERQERCAWIRSTTRNAVKTDYQAKASSGHLPSHASERHHSRNESRFASISRRAAGFFGTQIGGSPSAKANRPILRRWWGGGWSRVCRGSILLVVAAAAIVTGLAGGLDLCDDCRVRQAFSENRYISLAWLVLPVIGALEQAGLQERARAIVG